MHLCTAQVRCRRTSCPTCAWRYCGQVAQRIEMLRPLSPMYAVEIRADLGGVAEFRHWRTKMRNVIDHRRRSSRWWCNLLLVCWLGVDGPVRGILCPGAITGTEFVQSVGRRWTVTLRPVDASDLRLEVYGAMEPREIFGEGGRGRYHFVRLAVWPRALLRSPTR